MLVSLVLHSLLLGGGDLFRAFEGVFDFAHICGPV